MRIVLAPDSFKESISAAAVCETLAAVFRAGGHEPISVPIADGGEGTVDAVLAAVRGERVVVRVEGPLGDPVDACYALIDQRRAAMVEMAAASGLQLVPQNRRNAIQASTYGTGQLIRDAVARGVKRIVVGVGGSATTDGGAGCAQALGVSLLDGQDDELSRGGEALLGLERIDVSARVRGLDETELIVACDVTNPLVGPNGSAHMYAPQKGADPEQVELLDRALTRFANVVFRDVGVAVAEMPGAGAAGGLAAGLVALCGGRIEAGFQTIAVATGLDTKIADADCVVTGEGRYDEQTAHGKAVSGVCELARNHAKPVHLIAGAVRGAPAGIFASVNELTRIAGDAAEAQKNPRPHLKRAAAIVADLLER